MVNTYVLVNPHIEGTFKSKVKADNSQEAANKLYTSLSEHFNNSIPTFYFTIQKGSSGEGQLYHFEVKEKRKENEVTFKVESMKIRGLEQAESQFKSKLENIKSKRSMEGGKKRKHKKSKKHDSSDSDSDFDSSSDDYKKSKSYMPVNQPIYYWWYDPYVYNLSSVYIPTFYSYIAPTFEVALITYP